MTYFIEGSVLWQPMPDKSHMLYHHDIGGQMKIEKCFTRHDPTNLGLDTETNFGLFVAATSLFPGTVGREG